MHAYGPTEDLTNALPTHFLLWRLNQACNFDCAYCFRDGMDPRRGQEHPACGRYTPKQIADSFDRTGKSWHIHLTGGEPFLYPRFTELAQALTEKHRLGINTNLFTPHIPEFADRVSPGNIHAIYATAHLQELKKRPNGIRRFIEHALLLQDRGFRIIVLYLTYPPFLKHMAEDIENFKAHGIRHLRLKIFRGKYKGKSYPKSYSTRQKEQIQAVFLSAAEQGILQGETCFQNLNCLAGHRAFCMDITGNLTRCSTLSTGHGNLFANNFHFDASPSVCPAKECICPYQGVKFAQGAGSCKPGKAFRQSRLQSLVFQIFRCTTQI